MLVRKGARFGAATLLCAAAFGAAACGNQDSSESAAAGGSKAAAPAELGQAELDWGVKFTQGKAGKADSAKEPFVIGWANQQGGTPSYPQATAGAEAAVKFINDELGGIAGRPVKLETCFMLAEEDGQKCGAKFSGNKDVQVVGLGLAAVGNASLYKTVLKDKPVVVATSAAQPDTTTPGVYTFNGGALSPIAADGLLAAQVKGAKRSAVMHSNNPIGTFVAQKILKPVLESQKLKVTLVPIGDTATAPEVASAIQAAGAGSADVFQMTTLDVQCVSAYDALKQQNLTPKVVTTYQCSQPAMREHLDGKNPAGWIFTSFGDSPQIENAENGQKTYVAAMTEQGQKDDITYHGDASMSFSTVMTLARIGNELGDKASPETIRKAIVDYDGPLMMTPGKPKCGKVSKQFPGVCTTVASVAEADENGKLRALEPLDVSAILK
jgi:branched-chain amino acid transport system substrate-binding protein